MSKQKLIQFRDLAYETGYMAAQVEAYVDSAGKAGWLYDEQKQRRVIEERNRLQEELIEALRAAE